MMNDRREDFGMDTNEVYKHLLADIDRLMLKADDHKLTRAEERELNALVDYCEIFERKHFNIDL